MRTESKPATTELLTSFLEELGVKFLKDSTDKELAIRCIKSLMERITRENGLNIRETNVGESYVCALYVFILADYIARIFAMDVGELTVLAYGATFAKHQDSHILLRSYEGSAHSYDDFCQNNPESLKVSVAVLSGCIVGPDSAKSLLAAPKIFASLVDGLVEGPFSSDFLVVDSLVEEPSASEFPAVIDKRQEKVLEGQVFWLIIGCLVVFIIIASMAIALLS